MWVCRNGQITDESSNTVVVLPGSCQFYKPSKTMETAHSTSDNKSMDAIALLKQVDSHWREFGPEHGFGELMDKVYAVIAQRHHICPHANPAYECKLSKGNYCNGNKSECSTD